MPDVTYDLAPEQPSRSAPAGDEVSLPEPGRRARRREQLEIDDDLPCVACGYNLRGLTKKHRCPECGTPAGFSTSGDLLQYAPVPWLRTVRNGLALLLWALGAAIGAFINSILSPGSGLWLDLASALLGLSGVLLLTTPEPRMYTAQEPFGVRRGIRLIAVLHLACAVSAFASPWAKVTTGISIASFTLSVGLLLLLALFLRRFAGRIPDVDLERSTTHVIWGVSVSLGVCVFFAAFSLTFASSPNVIGPAPCLSMLAATSAAVFAGWFLILLFSYYGSVKWAAHDAEMQFEPPPAKQLEAVGDESSDARTAGS